MTFKEFGLEAPILKALEVQGYTQPTPIQERSIPILLKGGDLLGVAQTGTGKTAAFGIPILNHLIKETNTAQSKRKIKALVITPTRELAMQIAESFTTYSKFTNLKNTTVFGGVKQGQQVNALRRGVDILIATPGRLLDLMNQGFITFHDLKYVVLDEADQMLDMGFIHDIKKIISRLPAKRQSLFFSATMPAAMVDLSQKMLGDFERVTIKPEQATAEKVEQGVYFVSKSNKPKLLIDFLEGKEDKSVLIFSRTKNGANKIDKKLNQVGIKSTAIHGDKTQAARQKALKSFKDGVLNVLVATDIAARGLDIDSLAFVINYDLPGAAETYIHRIGRTGRANASGVAISFCMDEERSNLRDIEKLIKQKIPRLVSDQPYVASNHNEDKTIVKRQSSPPPRSGNNFRSNSRRPNTQKNEGRYKTKNKS